MKDNERPNSTGIIEVHLTTELHGCFNNCFQSVFTYAGIQYQCVGRYMIAQKVALGQRYDLLDELLATGDAFLVECAAKDKIWGLELN